MMFSTPEQRTSGEKRLAKEVLVAIPRLQTLAKELLLKIFRETSPDKDVTVDTLALGLTCKTFYLLLKAVFELKSLLFIPKKLQQFTLLPRFTPNPQPDTEYSERKVAIIDLIGQFLGEDRYREIRMAGGDTLFLNRSIFGEAPGNSILGVGGKRKRRHTQRDLLPETHPRVKLLQSAITKYRLWNSHDVYKQFGCVLQNPRGKGLGWFGETKEAMHTMEWKQMEDTLRWPFVFEISFLKEEVVREFTLLPPELLLEDSVRKADLALKK